MLDEKFLGRLRTEFPLFYEKVDREAAEDAVKLRLGTGGDVEKALARARLQGAARLWWPYVKGSVPFVGRDREAMEGFSRLVLTIDHLVGHTPNGMEGARAQVVGVLRQSLDYERLRDLVQRRDDESKAAAAAGAGLVASASALMAPVTMFRNVRKYGKFVPPPARVAVAAVIVAALASVPLVAGYSAGRQAERSARGGTTIETTAAKGVPIDRAA